MLTKIRSAVSNRMRQRAERARFTRYQPRLARELSFTQAVASFRDRNGLYAYMHHNLHHGCPTAVRCHRKYFSQQQRGFGEDALHAMWWLLLREFTPSKCLEIGVYRGQVISLWSLIGQLAKFSIDVHGISPFLPLGDTVSKYRPDIDYFSDTLEAFNNLNVARPTLVRALSTDPAGRAHIGRHRWDLVYIDGSHEYEVVLSDYEACRDALAPGGLLVLDDSSVDTTFRPPRFAFPGHVGPSRVAAEQAMRELTFIGAVGHNSVFKKR